MFNVLYRRDLKGLYIKVGLGMILNLCNIYERIAREGIHESLFLLFFEVGLIHFYCGTRH